MALPAPKLEPASEEVERIFRPVRGADGELRIQELPATLENLLNPRLEDQLTQSNRHLLTLVPVFDALKRYLKRLAPHLAVFSDLMLLYKRHGERDVSPDIAVVEGLPDDLEVDDSLDVLAQGGRLRLVMEVVSTSTADLRKKDEEVNPKLFAKLGVEDYVLVYPPKGEKSLRVEARKFAGPGRYRPNPPDPEGRIFLRSVGLWLLADEEAGRLVLVHRATGERLLTSEEEEAARRAEEKARREAERRAAREAEARRTAERRAAREGEARQVELRRAAETLVKILESRALPLTDDDRSRILTCRDADEIARWTDRAFTVQTVGELWVG